MGARSPLWRHRDFLNVWTAETISVLGAQFTFLAVPLTAVLMLEAGPEEMGILYAAEMLPFLLFGLVVGVWVDRMKRRPLMIVSDLGRCAVLGVIPVAWWLDLLSMPVLYVTAFCAGVFTVFFDVAYMSYLPSLVDRENLTDANSKLEITRSASGTVGPSIAGLVVQVITAPFAVAFNSLTYFASAVFLFRIKKEEPAPVVKERPSTAKEVREGLDLIIKDRRLAAIAGCTATSNLFGSMIMAVMVLYAVDQYALDSLDIGIVFAAGSVGAILGALLMGRVSERVGLGKSIMLASLFSSVAALLLVFVPEGLALVSFCASMLMTGVFVTIYNVGQVSLRQAIAPDHQLGKMNASMRFMIWGTMPVGALLGGYLGETFGLWGAMAIGVFGGMAAFVWVALSPVMSIREIPKQDKTA